ncbi:unnamed protein product [Spirodela intermedia]|uniref:HMA domain-containing protein n=1 Tax=Spirodela intermedia TaxID=51605 RepID=A0A7I8IPU8_SPIIN|nr:unnamed protein product [Spirodela intermedia]CAA6659969.1 unnamed protein product [Spirodela intermedia]
MGEMKAEGGGDEGEKEASSPPPPPPPPPEEIVIRVYMHCEGCARTVRRSLKGFEGVEDVKTDCQTHEVVVKGKVAAADPLKVVDRVQRKSRRKVELLTPIPPKPEKEAEKKEEEKPKPEEKKEEAPPVMAVVLKVHMHCEACSLEIKKRILKMKGVQAAEPDVKNSQVTVKGLFEPAKLVEYVYKRTGKHAVVEKKADGGGTTGDVEKKDGSAAQTEKETKEGAVARLAEVTKNPFQYYYPRYQMEYAYPPQIFSDENPNACSVM